MKERPQPRFDVATLRKLAGAKVFARGEEYHADGQVELLSVERNRVLAQVAGSEDYRTVLTGRGKKIGGECSCPAYTDWGFCKHMVAAALAVNESGEEEGDEATAVDRIRAHLKQQGIDRLVGMIVELAEHDMALFRKLDVAAAAATAGDDKGLEKRLQQAIDSATRTRGFVGYDEAEAWADNVGTALEAVAQLADGPHAALAAKLAMHAIDRIEGAVKSIDDSEGQCHALLERASDIHLDACQAAKPDPVELARDLISRELDESFDTFFRAVAVYADVLGEAGLAEYRRLATEALNNLPPPARKREGTKVPFRLESILDFFAERDGDVEARIALRARDLSSSAAYLQLARFCLEQGRPEEALRRAEEGLWMFEDGAPDGQLVLFVAECLTKAGRKNEAAAHLWKAFEKVPDFELYQRLRRLGGKAVRDRALSYLNARLDACEPAQEYIPAAVLIELLIEEKMFDAAWVAVRRYEHVGRDLVDGLVEASEKTHPNEALEVHAETVESHVARGGNENYEAACRLIAHMAGLRDARSHKAYLAALKERHQRKRNFIKLLG